MKTSFAWPVAGLIAFALAGPSPSVAADQVSVRPADQVQWGPAPPSVPPGAGLAVLSGDPSGEGHYVIRVRFPPNYEVAAHTHPTTEFVTVLEGALHVGHGDVLDRSKGQELRPGAFAVMPAGHRHFAWTGPEGTTFQIHGQGPFVVNYVDPAKDPQRGTTTTAR